MGHGYPGMAQHLWQEKKRKMKTTWRGTEGEIALWSNWAGWWGGGCGNIVQEERAICSRQCSNLISGSISFDPWTVQSSPLDRIDNNKSGTESCGTRHRSIWDNFIFIIGPWTQQLNYLYEFNLNTTNERPSSSWRGPKLSMWDQSCPGSKWDGRGRSVWT